MLLKHAKHPKDTETVMFRCPGCRSSHVVYIKNGPITWCFNNDYKKPTITPSVLNKYTRMDSFTKKDIKKVCHLFIKDGRIQYLNDCTHDHAGKTVDMIEYKEEIA